MSAVVETDVLVVGAGPAGASSAVFLSKHGVRTIMISRHRSTSETPQAHITNQRAMEALRDAGLEPACRAVATTRPGSSLPHAWLGSRMPSPRISTLDIAGKCRFMLFSGPGGQAWRSAAVAVAEATGIELGVALIGPYLDYEDLYGTWHELSEVQEDGCVLVRPDLHVAWRSLTLPSDPTATLTRVMQRLLGLIEA